MFIHVAHDLSFLYVDKDSDQPGQLPVHKSLLEAHPILLILPHSIIFVSFSMFYMPLAKVHTKLCWP